MHAYLIIGNGAKYIENSIEALVKKLKVKTLEFPLAKIDDVRALNSFVSLTISEPTAIIVKDVDSATIEALNAFLKNLEEPQENLYYILTARSIHKVLPTIASRCELIKTANNQQLTANSDVEKYLKMNMAEKLAYLDKIKDREEAVDFTTHLIEKLHADLNARDVVSHREIVRKIEAASLTLERIKGNGNVTLQLANMVILSSN